MGKMSLLDTRKRIIIYKAIKYLFYVKKEYSIIFIYIPVQLGSDCPMQLCFLKVGLHSDLL